LLAEAEGHNEAFWDEFGLRVGRLGEAALSAPLSPFETQEVFNKLESLRKIMKQGGGSSSSWLSYIRNEIQYRQQFDSWIPSSIKNGEQNSLWRLGEKWTKDPLSIDLNVSDKSLHKFVSACAFIISACRVMLLRIAERSTDGPKSFLNVGPLSILKKAGMGN
jgi:hypothetical protein